MRSKEIKAIEDYIKFMAGFTVRIISCNQNGELINSRSGFLYHPNGKGNPLVITAGHDLSELGNLIETNLLNDNRQPLCVQTGKFEIFYNTDDVDYAYSYLPLEKIQNSIGSNIKFELQTYIHRFFKAKEGEAYGFAVFNDYNEYTQISVDTYDLRRYWCYEVGLELVGQDDNLNYFQTASQKKEHEFYEGASGSPIADCEGRINSILIGGCDNDDYLRAARLDNISLPKS